MEKKFIYDITRVLLQQLRAAMRFYEATALLGQIYVVHLIVTCFVCCTRPENSLIPPPARPHHKNYRPHRRYRRSLLAPLLAAGLYKVVCGLTVGAARSVVRPTSAFYPVLYARRQQYRDGF